jgi:YbbR domain-containing protein
VEISPSTISATVDISAAGKSVTVFANVIGEPPGNLDILNRATNPSAVVIDGPQEALDSIVFLNTEPVDVTGATGNIIRRVGIAGLPEGVRVIEPSDGKVQVSIQIAEQSVRQELTGLPIQVVNLAAGLTATANPQSATIVIIGTAETLASINTDNFKIQVDASGLGAGTHILTPAVSAPAGITWISTDPVTVEVTITDGASTATSPAGTPPAVQATASPGASP